MEFLPVPNNQPLLSFARHPPRAARTRQDPDRHRLAAPVPLPASWAQVAAGSQVSPRPAGVTVAGGPRALAGAAEERSLPVGGAALGMDAHRGAEVRATPAPAGRALPAPARPLAGDWRQRPGRCRCAAGAAAAGTAAALGASGGAGRAEGDSDSSSSGGGGRSSSRRRRRRQQLSPCTGRCGARLGHLCPAAPRSWWPRTGAGRPQTPLCMRDGAQPPAVALPCPRARRFSPACHCGAAPRTLPGVSTAGAGLGRAGGPPYRGSAGPAAPWGGLRQGRGAGPQRPSGPAGLGPWGTPRRWGGAGLGRGSGRAGGRGAAALRGFRGRGGPLLRGGAALGCALITGQMSEQLRGVLLAAWLFERCHCSASSSSLSLVCFTLDQLPREPGEGFSVALPLSPFHGSIPPRCACNLCLRQKQRAFS